MPSYESVNSEWKCQHKVISESECDPQSSDISITMNKVPVIVRCKASRAEEVKVRGPKRNKCRVLNNIFLPVRINLNPRLA